jgi:hypothetical protein
MSIIRIFISVLLMGTCLLSSHVAFAADTKIIPPYGCIPLVGATNANWYPNGGRMWNYGGSSITIVCPIIRDNTSNTDGMGFSMKVVNSTGNTFTCTLQSFDETASVVKSVSRSTSGVGYQVLEWNHSLDESTVDGSYQVWCTVPPGAGIILLRPSEP